MSDQILKATHGSPDHPLRIGDFEIPCYVLNDGRRVLIHTGVISALGMSRGGNPRKGGDRLARFVTGKGLKPFAREHLLEVIASPILFKISGRIAYGYEATILADICDAVLEARKNDALQQQQLHIADRCEILMRGFARVGIIALVDEATGYQEVRSKNELRRILEMYIAPELRPWIKTFPDEYYEQLFRLRGWQYNPLSVKRPKLVGKLTNQIVYEKLPPGVLDALQKLNPVEECGRRRHKHHQHLSSEIGKDHLERHLASITTLMRVSPNWLRFSILLERAFPTFNTTPHIAGLEELLDDMNEAC